ncbi:MAG: NADP-dependent oxidoreductase [Cryobacterium sp.]|nr:NADP-dependent oxidoreductase [Cryobacterium sp.]MBX3090796.1 NADP-dependent oxidoreductase [Cryobacterium sp.]MBX3115976.1 NADP-dependent oxidoreductase [Cryobacterium sp.]
MLAAVMTRPGGPEVLELREVPRPAPAIAEAVVRVRGAGVNPIDAKTRAGGGASALIRDYPAVLGVDFCGVIERPAFDSHDFQPGDVVYGLLPVPRVSGSYAQFATAHVAMIARAPRSLTALEAGALPCAALTAWGCVVTTGRIEAGQRVLIHAGAGGVGHLAVQLAALAGAHVITTSSADNSEWLRSLGAAEVIDYRNERFEDVTGEIDVVIDLIGNVRDNTGSRSLEVLRKGGLLISVPTGSWPTFREECAAAAVRSTDIKAISSTAALTEIANLVDAGSLKIRLEKTFPLSEARAAHELIETGHSKGKIALEIP